MRELKRIEDVRELSIVLKDEKAWPRDSGRRVLVKLLPNDDILTIASIYLDADEDVTDKQYGIRIELEPYDTRYTWFNDKGENDREEFETIRDTIKTGIKKFREMLRKYVRRANITLGVRQYDKLDRALWDELFDLIPQEEADAIMKKHYKEDVLSGLSRAIYSARRIEEEWLIDELDSIRKKVKEKI